MPPAEGSTADFDSLQFLDGASKRVIKSWISREERQLPIPWAPMRKPLSESRVALISSAAVRLRSDRPFDEEGERENPWWGDPSYRVIPRGTQSDDVRLHHLHIERSYGESDLDCVLPLTRLEELAEAGVIGEPAPSHYSFMGYLLRPGQFLRTSVPAIIERMEAEAVDAALLVPV
jgi:D-proline reductase (dithiol) PrdB